MNTDLLYTNTSGILFAYNKISTFRDTINMVCELPDYDATHAYTITSAGAAQIFSPLGEDTRLADVKTRFIPTEHSIWLGGDLAPVYEVEENSIRGLFVQTAIPNIFIQIVNRGIDYSGVLNNFSLDPHPILTNEPFDYDLLNSLNISWSIGVVLDGTEHHLAFAREIDAMTYRLSL